jgi:hypothetical protein
VRYRFVEGQACFVLDCILGWRMGESAGWGCVCNRGYRLHLTMSLFLVLLGSFNLGEEPVRNSRRCYSLLLPIHVFSVVEWTVKEFIHR